MSGQEIPDGFADPAFFPVTFHYPGNDEEGIGSRQFVGLCTAVPRVGEHIHGGKGRMLVVERVIHDFKHDPAARMAHQFITVILRDDY